MRNLGISQSKGLQNCKPLQFGAGRESNLVARRAAITIKTRKNVASNRFAGNNQVGCTKFLLSKANEYSLWYFTCHEFMVKSIFLQKYFLQKYFFCCFKWHDLNHMAFVPEIVLIQCWLIGSFCRWQMSYERHKGGRRRLCVTAAHRRRSCAQG